MSSSSSLSSSSSGSNGSITDVNPSGDRAAHELAKLREDCHQVELQTAKFFQAVRDVPVVSGSDGKSKRIPKRDRKERVLDLSSQFYSIANGLHNACSKQAEQATRVLHSSKKHADPSKPKRPLTSYLIYANEHRQQLRDERPEEKSAARMARMGEMWRKLTDDEKRPYQGKARVGEDLYREHLIKWSKDNGIPITTPNTSSSSSSSGKPGKKPSAGQKTKGSGRAKASTTSSVSAPNTKKKAKTGTKRPRVESVATNMADSGSTAVTVSA